MESELQKRLSARMKEKGLSVAKLEQLAGVKRNIARNILKGQSQRPSAENLQALAKALECTTADLLKSPQNTAASVRVEDPFIFEQIVCCVLELFQEKQEAPSLDKLTKILKEVYLYATKREPQGIDKKFIAWLMDQTML